MNSDYTTETLSDWKEIKQILLLFNVSFPRSLIDRVGDLEKYARKLAENAIVFSICMEDKVLGFAACYCNDKLNKQAYLAQIAVNDAYRRLNLGSCLMKLCIETARQKGMEKLILEVDDDNVAAQNLYAKYEFIKTGKASGTSHYFERIL